MSNHEKDNRPERVSNHPLQIKSWKNRIRLHSMDYNDLLLESIDEVFVDLLGTRVRDAFYDALERNQRIAREELSQHLDKFQEALETVLGSGGDTVGRTIAKRLYAKLALDFTPRSDYRLTDYVEARSRNRDRAGRVRDGNIAEFSLNCKRKGCGFDCRNRLHSILLGCSDMGF